MCLSMECILKQVLYLKKTITWYNIDWTCIFLFNDRSTVDFNHSFNVVIKTNDNN